MNTGHANSAAIRLLANLERKLAIDAARARAAHAQACLQASSADDELRQLRKDCVDHERRAAMLAGERWEVTSHGQALKHLVHLWSALARGEQGAQVLRERVVEAATACAPQVRKLDSVRELRAEAEHRQAAQAQTHAATEADRAWLARWTSSATGAGT